MKVKMAFSRPILQVLRNQSQQAIRIHSHHLQPLHRLLVQDYYQISIE